jgi:hypothetical protein
MKVFADYEESEAPLLRVWVRSWTARGWEPRLLSYPPTRFHPQMKPGTFLKVLPRVINFSFRPSRKGLPRVIGYGKRGWKTAALVRFPAGTTEDQVLTCGREF